LPWQVNLDLSAQVTWAFSDPYRLTFAVSAFNVLNLQDPTAIDQRFTFDFVAPMKGAQCSARNAVSRPDPLAAVLKDCPDLAYARTVDGQRVTPNLNYGRPSFWQEPIRVRLGVAVSF
jgi:hypothetical protein